MNNRKIPDHYTQKAKKAGLAARSIYKLEAIDARWHLFHPKSRVLDLGCSPGSWLQYVAQKVGSQGYILGIDLKPVNVTLPQHIETRVGDVFEFKTDIMFDVILSDMAPKTMGDHATDAIRSTALIEKAIDLADHCLKVGGHLVVKALEGGDMPRLIKALRLRYARLELLRPEATRKQSTEIFLVGLNRK